MRNQQLTVGAAGVLLIAAALAGCGGGGAKNGSGATSEAIDFRGKTITLITDGGPGSGQDLRTRSTALSLPNILPGHPRVVVQNLSGGGGARGLRELADAPKDGTVLMDVNPRWFVRELIGGPSPDYSSEAQLIGAVGVKKEGQALWVWEDVAKNWDEVMAHDCCLKIAEGTRGPQSAPLVLAKSEGAPLDIIFGFADDSVEQAAAFFRHETDASPLNASDVTEENAKGIVPVMWYGEIAPLDYENLKPILAAKGITQNPPHLYEAMSLSEGKRAALDAVLGGFGVHRGAFALPAGTPENIRSIWEDALKQVSQDPGYGERLLAQGENPSDFGYASRDQVLAFKDSVEKLTPEERKFFVDLVGEVE